MFIQFITFLCTIQIFTDKCKCGKFVDLPSDSGESDLIDKPSNSIESSSKIRTSPQLEQSRTSIKFENKLNAYRKISRRMRRQDEEQGEIINEERVFKELVSSLVEQCILDHNRTLHSLDRIRNPIRSEAPYQIGFITRYIKHQRDLMNDLFDMAIKNRDNVLLLNQMNVFEHVMHTSVNITNLVSRLVSIHIRNRESHKTSSEAPLELPPQPVFQPSPSQPSPSEATPDEPEPTGSAADEVRRIYPLHF